MEKGKRIEILNGENSLPEALIQHIQSYLWEKEAARTTILSKSWYSAWLTRPVLNFDYGDFPRKLRLEHPVPYGDNSNFNRESWLMFVEYAKKTMQRYLGLSMKIENFRLAVDRDCSWAHDLIIDAMTLGATDVDLQFPYKFPCTLPKEVFGSKTLITLSLSRCIIVDGNLVRCSRLQFLSFKSVEIASKDGVKDIISCCVLIEDLSLSSCIGLKLSRVNVYELHKLRRLFLDSIDVDDSFFTDFTSRFPCLKDLAILDCYGYTRIGITSTSLETICFTTTPIRFVTIEGSWRARFDVPNIRKFTYSGTGLPTQLSVKGGSTKWELAITIEYNRFYKNSRFLNLKKLLTKFRRSRISLNVNLSHECKEIGRSEHEVDVEVASKPLAVENLAIGGPCSLHFALLLRLLGICRPKFLHDMLWSSNDIGSDMNASFATRYKGLMHRLITLNSGTPDQNLFGKFGLKKVNMEVYKRFDEERQPLVLEKPLDPSGDPIDDHKIWFELIWD